LLASFFIGHFSLLASSFHCWPALFIDCFSLLLVFSLQASPFHWLLLIAGQPFHWLLFIASQLFSLLASPFH